ncbi:MULTISPECIES: hypothetical protein [Halolamina]|uniref:Uncharacterized protein n=1 Tax=Halolamina pelagica TaxID=699431 RepID=A0A1I5THQ7_9EURY|nr:MULTISPECIES: hypothetical protein [Halolamina]NHX37358.1 hypothetical protein [Halolamina sp. R1-12]SFP82590.1 hypothetical protein SAMN05216277_10992 [Halolamina pelagica]
MVAPTQVALWLLALATLGVGATFVFRTETALALQKRVAERLSWAPPSEHPDYYEDTREHRRWTFRFGGVVLLLVGVLLLGVSVYGTFFVASVPP